MFLPWLLCALGIGTLFAVWRGRLGNRRVAGLLAVVALLAAVVTWIGRGGAEYGSLYAILASPFVAWAFVTANRSRGNGRPVAQHRTGLAMPAVTAFGRNAGLFLLVMVVAAVAAILGCVLVASWLPWSDVNQLAVGVLMAPVVWGLFAYWLCAADRVWRPAVALSLLAVVSALLLYV